MGWLVIRVRGGIHARRDIVETLRQLHLTRQNHATVVAESPSARGMINRVQGYVTWGEAESETVELMLAKRGVNASGGPVVSAEPTAPDLKALSHQVVKDGMAPMRGVRPLFRLRPPRGGWRSTKRVFALGGALGYRGPAINDLARRML